MNEAIFPELMLLLYSVAAGVLSFFGYDLLLVLRVFLGKHTVLEKITDVLYWLAASVLVFSMIHVKNSGVIRGYSVVGMLCGMLVYRLIAGEKIVNATRRRVDKCRNWWKKHLEPIQKKKKELQNQRKQSKLKRKEQRAEEKQKRRQKQKELQSERNERKAREKQEKQRKRDEVEKADAKKEK